MKKTILKIIGLTLLFPLYLKEVWAIDIDNFNDQILRPDNLPTGTAAQSAPVEVKINTLLNYATDLILFTSGGVAVFFFVVAGIQYITSLGNQERMDAAKKTIKHTALGLLAAIFAYAVVTNVIDIIFRATV